MTLTTKKREQPATVDQDNGADKLVRAMRRSALTELRELSGPNSGSRALEIMREVRRYDAWLGEER